LEHLQQLPRTVHLLPRYGPEGNAARMGFARFKNDEENVIEIQGLEERDSKMEQLDPRDLVLQVKNTEDFFTQYFAKRTLFMQNFTIQILFAVLG
jgi:hypothetical protein